MNNKSCCTAIVILLLLWSSLASAADNLPGVATQYQISVDPAAHRKFGLFYPATYKFRLPPGSSRLAAQINYGQSGWMSLPEKRRSDLFNGIDAVRFDYAGGYAYVSARFITVADSFYLRFIDGSGQPAAVTFDSIPKYYDDRTAAASIVLDDWNIEFDQNFDLATRHLQADNLYFSVAVITGDVNWQSLQQHVDLLGDLMEVASHGVRHCGDAAAYAASGYDVETAGSRDRLAANLHYSHQPYVPLYVEPFGYSDDQLEAAVSAANYLVERCSNNFFNSGANFIPWDPTKGRYGRAAETFDDDVPGDTPELLTEGNAAFDKILAMGGIYTLVDHPHPLRTNWDDNSYLLQHLDYIKGRSNIWYVPFGQLYQYHFLQELRGNLTVQPSPASPLQASFTARPLSGTAPLSVAFTDTSTGSISAWSWDFGDGTVTTAKNPIHVYNRAGTYHPRLTVTSSDGNATLSASAAVTVTPPAGTAVRISSPLNGTRFNPPANVTLAATATAASGASIRRVDFYSGTALLGTATAAPYSVTWSGVKAGTYSVTAKVTDSLGAVATSPLVTITVLSPLPAPWATKDVGAVGEPGSANYTNDFFTLSGAGAGISGTADSFRYVYKPMTGDGQIIARVTSLQNTDPFAKAGVMLRESLAADSMHAMMAVSAQKGAEFLGRSKTGGISTSTLRTGVAVPYWVRLVRRGNLLTGYVSSDAVNWAVVGSSAIAMSSTVYAGFAVTSNDNSVLCSSGFDSKVVPGDLTPPVVTSFQAPKISRSLTVPITAFTATDDVGVTGYLITESPVTPATTAAAPPSTAAAPGATAAAGGALPAPWSAQDIGAVGMKGSTSYLDGTFTVNGGGAQTSGGEDAETFVYKVTSGDGQITARVVSLQGNCTDGEAGVMMRQGVAADSVNAAMALGPGGGAFSRRVVEKGSTTVTNRAGLAAPYWIRLVRNGNNISSYISSDGANWAVVESDEVPMGGPVLVGLMAASGATSAVCSATFDNVN
jgi:PKD repeat protein